MGKDKKIFKNLGQSFKKEQIIYNKPDSSILETFENPFTKEKIRSAKPKNLISIEVNEFTSLCPMTGLPDYGKIVIDYIPAKLCLESKSFKFYLLGFRMFGIFHEAAINLIFKDLIDTLDPEYIKVKGSFNSRGGISFNPSIELENEKASRNLIKDSTDEIN